MAQEKNSALRVRRLLRQDLGAAQGLYASLEADGAWAQDGGLEQMLRHGELWGGFRAGGMSICSGLCPVDAPVALTLAAKATDLLPARALLVLPPAGSSGDMRRFTEILLARAGQRFDSVPAALVSVKNGSGFVAGCFAAQLQMVGVRPLVALRPHYIFLPCDRVQNDAKESIIIPIGDTLQLSRLLAEGWRGVMQWGEQIELRRS